ncbi:MAG TPA: hypothetical protein VHZ95_08300, partial [Polyangiales bacterium]|nr:hypothetical protein [Polyangiales bacterium]
MRSAARALHAIPMTVFICAACGGGTSTLPPAAQTTPAPTVATAAPPPPGPPPMKEAPPASGPAREIHFPPIERTAGAGGLEINTVALHGVPVVQIKLVIKAGSAADPADLPG